MNKLWTLASLSTIPYYPCVDLANFRKWCTITQLLQVLDTFMHSTQILSTPGLKWSPDMSLSALHLQYPSQFHSHLMLRVLREASGSLAFTIILPQYLSWFMPCLSLWTHFFLKKPFPAELASHHFSYKWSQT